MKKNKKTIYWNSNKHYTKMLVTLIGTCSKIVIYSFYSALKSVSGFQGNYIYVTTGTNKA